MFLNESIALEVFYNFGSVIKGIGGRVLPEIWKNWPSEFGAICRSGTLLWICGHTLTQIELRLIEL